MTDGTLSHYKCQSVCLLLVVKMSPQPKCYSLALQTCHINPLAALFMNLNTLGLPLPCVIHHFSWLADTQPHTQWPISLHFPYVRYAQLGALALFLVITLFHVALEQNSSFIRNPPTHTMQLFFIFFRVIQDTTPNCTSDIVCDVNH